MIHIKSYIDLVSSMEGRQKRELVLSAEQARNLRDEIAKVLADNIELRMNAADTQVIQVDVSGGKW